MEFRFVVTSVLIAFIDLSSGATFQKLFPEQNRLYSYALKSNVTAGTLTPIEDGSYWVLEATLYAQAYDDFGRVRLHLDNLKTLVYTKESVSTDQRPEAVEYLKSPFEVGICYSTIHVREEPVWATNIKRAIAFNFLVDEAKGSLNSIEEPCLYGYCLSVYSRVGNRIRKYSGGATRRRHVSSFERCGPTRVVDWRSDRITDTDPNYLMTAERDYYIDENIGLEKMELQSKFQYKTHDHILSVTTEMTLTYEDSKTVGSIQKLNLTESPIQYAFHNYSNPSNGIWETEQGALKNNTYETLLKIARKGIDADNIVRNASLIHSLDFIHLLNAMSQLNFESLKKLFEDVLGTSYELETARNIFLEVLPYVRTEAGARLIRRLVVEQKTKIEDSMLLSLIRKLPYTIVDLTKHLLEELEVFTKLGLDYPQEIRHAGILSFATLVNKAMEANYDQQYFDDIYDKYLRMYNYCPQYVDRLVWLQGLANIGKSGVNYLDEIYTDTRKDRHERLWASLASLSIWKGASLENTLTILMNETEHIQLRIFALHAILSSSLGPRDFYNVHNYIKSCSNDQLMKFWYSTMKSLGNNRFYEKYKSASYYITFLAAQLKNPGLKQWATNNYIISQEPTLDLRGPTFQLLTVGGAWSGPPELVMVEFSTGGEIAFNGAIYIIAEGVTSNIFRRLQNLNTTEHFSDELLKILLDMKVTIVEREKVHIDIVIKVKGTTVYATHIDHEKFSSWNAEDLRKSIEDFVRFGSHINQQMVYYPTQMVKDFPTEIGTPVRLQSTIVFFASIRGNLTAPSTDDLTWRNDLHIRYQGTGLTSLSTDGALQPSEHTARIQQSMVIHLPTKFDVRFSPVARSLELIWTNPAQNGGVAMHSRTQVTTWSRNKKKVFTVSSKSVHEKNDGIFFDCENPMTRSQISEQLRSRSNKIFPPLHPAHLILNSIQLITSPTSGSCGVILPPVQLPTAHQLGVEFKIDDIEDKDDQMSIRMAYSLDYYKKFENIRNNYFTAQGYLELKSDGRNEAKMGAEIKIYQYDGPPGSNFSICFKGSHLSSPFNIDFTEDPATYKGDFSIYTSYDCSSNDSIAKFEVNYENRPSSHTDRDFSIRIHGKHVPAVDIKDLNILGYSDTIELLNKLANRSEYEYSNNATVKEQNGQMWVDDDRASSAMWLPPSSTPMQILKRLGFYHECRISPSEVFQKQLIVGDCTNKPRFAVTLTNLESGSSIVTVYSTKNSATFNWSPNQSLSFKVMTADDQIFKDDLRIIGKGDEHVLRSRLSGILVYHQPNETVILVPQPFMYTACGVCVDHS